MVQWSEWKLLVVRWWRESWAKYTTQWAQWDPKTHPLIFPPFPECMLGKNTRQWPDIDIGILTQNGLLWEEGPTMREVLDLTFLTKRVNQEQKAHPCGNPEISATTYDQKHREWSFLSQPHLTLQLGWWGRQTGLGEWEGIIINLIRGSFQGQLLFQMFFPY